jgi:hypothetical protein
MLLACQQLSQPSSAANPGRPIKPILYIGLNEFFGFNMINVEMEAMKDKNGVI